MEFENEFFPAQKKKSLFFYRLSQFVALLLGAKIFVVLVLTFALYTSTFFLFNHEEGLRNFVFDLRVNGILLCSIVSILAGGLINQFYDKEKDGVTKPFRSKLQSFLKEKYFLYAYLFLNGISLTVSWFISPRFFIYLLIYQFMMWFYSHKLSKIVLLNNLTFVALSLYPFFGMLVYYKTFSVHLFLMAVFLFLILYLIDIVKDTLTKNADKVFGYQTLPNFFGSKITDLVVGGLLVFFAVTSLVLLFQSALHTMMQFYFGCSVLISFLVGYYYFSSIKNSNFIVLNILRLWVFVGIIAMLVDGILRMYPF